MKSNQIILNCKIGKNTKIWNFVNLYGCKIGKNSTVGSFVEIQKNVVIGNKVKIGSHSFICEGVTIEDEVFIGHHAVFINDKYPKSTNDSGQLKSDSGWNLLKTLVKKGASIGSNVTIMGGITIGENALIGAGSLVTKNVPRNVVVAGNPTKVIGIVSKNL